MKIAMLAPFEESVPPQKYGGTELVVYNLVEELVKMGHEVTLLATGDSNTSANLEPVFVQSLRSLLSLKDNWVKETYRHVGIGAVVSYLAKNHFDIIHNHLGWRILPFGGLIKSKVVTTLHGPLNAQYQQEILKQYRSENFISISLNQRRLLPELNFVANVYNGIDLEKFKFNPKGGDYYVFLGRITPNKGPLEAIEVAKKASAKLILAAKIDERDQPYYKREIKPLIDGKQIQFVGEVNHEEKVELLGNAKALLAPIRWEEPFGLVFIEAMACGTPVVTLRKGAVPEIVIEGKNGFICEDTEDMARKLKEIHKIDRRFCHNHIKENFYSEKMAREYLEVYKKVAENTKD